MYVDGRNKRRAVIVRATIAVVAAGAMLAGSYALLGSGDHFALGGADGRSSEKPEEKEVLVSTVATGTVVTRIANAAELPEFIRHRAEVADFAARVERCDTRFIALSYAALWQEWEANTAWPGLRVHLAQLRDRYAFPIAI